MTSTVSMDQKLGLGWSMMQSTGMLTQDTATDDDTRQRHYQSDIGLEISSRGYMAPPCKVWIFSLPFLGRMQILKSFPGLIMSSIILLYWVYGNWSTWTVIILPRYNDNHMSILLIVLYAVISALCITSFVRAVTLNPGYLNGSLEPQDDWTVCSKCMNRRPPLAHHCRQCGHCVLRMDHHCPWINNCVGEENQFAFLMLLVYAYMLSLVTLTLDVLELYFMPPCVTCDKESFGLRHQRGILWLAVVMAVLMTCGAAGLYFTQHMSVLFNMPSMGWMRFQQSFSKLGAANIEWPRQTHTVLEVYTRICGDTPYYSWLLPCRRRHVGFLSRRQFHV